MLGRNGHWLCDVDGLVEGALSAVAVTGIVSTSNL